jgi:pimeloyl-ACP methyl ester carboxylesterase
MRRHGGWHCTWFITTVVLAVLTGTVTLPPTVSAAGVSSPTPCPGVPLTLKLGTATPVLLVHGFNDGPSRFTQGSPSLEDAIKAAVPDTTTIAFDYHLVATDWVTDAAIGPQLAQCITWLAATSAKQKGPGRIIIVAHSMGGLAVRCALSATCVNGPAADPNLIRLLITLGTPNTGSNPQTAGPVGDTVCTWIPACDALITLRSTSTAAQAMVPQTGQVLKLAPLPSQVPLVAIAGEIAITTDLFGSALNAISTGAGGFYDDGDIVVPVDSALAEAESSPGHDRPGAKSIIVNCGSVPINLAAVWGAATYAMKAPAPPVSCWHLTETTDPRWQTDITAAIKPAAQALSLRACTPAALLTAMAAKDPTNAAQRTVVTYDCESGWAVAEIHQPLTVNNGSVVQDTGFAVLQQTEPGWGSEGLGDGVCLHAGFCPGYALPPPAVLHLILQTAGLLSATTAQPELYIGTQFTPGALYKYPSGPSKIGIDNHDYLTNLQWAAGSQGDLTGTGTLHFDQCNPDCASGTYETFPVQITASNPQQCNVQIYPQGLANPSQTVNADIFNSINVQALQGSPPAYLVGDSVLRGPCT